MLRILVAEPLDRQAEAALAAAAEVVHAPRCDEECLRELIVDCDALVARTSTPVTRRVLEAGTRLRVVGIAGVGVDRVDLLAADELKIAVLNTPAAATDAVADLALTFMLHLLRPVPRLAEAYRRGHYKVARAQPHGRELRELTVGIVGLGRIGTLVARRCASGFGARVIYNDIRPIGPLDFPAEPVDKDTLWATSDIVTLHVPLTPQTRRLVDADVIARLRPRGFLINTARGAVVETAALTEALQTGRLAGAGLDVVEPEPLPADHPLFTCERCVLTPHIAARTVGGMRRMNAVVDDVLALLRGEGQPVLLG